MIKELTTVAPGRICLFGEHQDYLKLPVIAAAIDLQVTINGNLRPDRRVCVSMPDIDTADSFELPSRGKTLACRHDRDYFHSAINVLSRAGFYWQTGFDCTVRGNIPINAGCGSSSALTVAWCRYLISSANNGRELSQSSQQVAEWAYQAEVEEFGEPGGRMDHYAAALGGLHYLDFDNFSTINLSSAPLGAFVLGNSGEPKDTLRILRQVKNMVLSGWLKLLREDDLLEIGQFSHEQLQRYRSQLSPEELGLLSANIDNRDITGKAVELLKKESFDHRAFGRLLSDHQRILDERLNISTPKINRMLQAAMDAGALGGKINGSGGGGCMFAYAPEKPETVAEAIRAAGGEPSIIQISLPSN